MRPGHFTALIPLLAACSAAAGDPALPPSTALAAAETGADPALPSRIPGYELRVLDRRKPLRFEVAGVPAETSLPIFIYFPTADPGRAAGLVRQAYDDLQALARKPEWTAAELHAVLSGLDSALRLLDPSIPCPPSDSTASSPARSTSGASSPRAISPP